MSAHISLNTVPLPEKHGSRHLFPIRLLFTAGAETCKTLTDELISYQDENVVYEGCRLVLARAEEVSHPNICRFQKVLLENKRSNDAAVGFAVGAAGAAGPDAPSGFKFALHAGALHPKVPVGRCQVHVSVKKPDERTNEGSEPPPSNSFRRDALSWGSSQLPAHFKLSRGRLKAVNRLASSSLNQIEPR